MAKVIVFHYTDEGKFPPLSSEELTDLEKKLDSEEPPGSHVQRDIY